jgi:hypothetical protein
MDCAVTVLVVIPDIAAASATPPSNAPRPGDEERTGSGRRWAPGIEPCTRPMARTSQSVSEQRDLRLVNRLLQIATDDP